MESEFAGVRIVVRLKGFWMEDENFMQGGACVWCKLSFWLEVRGLHFVSICIRFDSNSLSTVLFAFTRLNTYPIVSSNTENESRGLKRSSGLR